MSAKKKLPQQAVTLVEAVETLSNIADLEFDREIGIAEPHEIQIQGESVKYRTIHWLKEQDPETGLTVIKNIFKVILSYLREFYKKEYRHVENKQALDRVKTIMVLVGEAAKKLDKYTNFFKGKNKKVSDLKEFRDLQQFYHSKIARKIDEGVLGKWILGLTKQIIEEKRAHKAVGAKTTNTKHIYVDLEAVKKDSEYELFFIRKEDGSRFYSSRLLRNIKLVSDFGSYFGKVKADDPLSSLKFWKDLYFHVISKNIIELVKEQANIFCRSSLKFKERELVGDLNEALMALYLASNPKNLLKNNPEKICGEYFTDFLHYLRKCLKTSYYQKLITYPPKKSNRLAQNLLKLIHTLCEGLFKNMRANQDLNDTIERLIAEANEEQSFEHRKAAKDSCEIWNRFASDYSGMIKLLKRHPNGPLIKLLESLEEGVHLSFDPLLQDNLPSQLYALYYQETKVINCKIPSPTRQRLINQALVVDEFLGFLRSCDRNREKHLLINLQDRTSWKEHFRSRALEQLQENSEFENCLVVVTLAKDTDFYHQLSPYHDQNDAKTFIRLFKEQFQDPNSGYFFSDDIHRKLFPTFIDEALKEIHKIFFSGKNVLTREQRLDFIEIFYLFLELKLIELVKPSSFSLTCKDGIDTGASASCALYFFLKIIENLQWTDEDNKRCNSILYLPALFLRERVMIPDRFNRMISFMRTIESVKNDFGAENFPTIIHEGFGELFQSDILNSLIIPPKA